MWGKMKTDKGKCLSGSNEYLYFRKRLSKTSDCPIGTSKESNGWKCKN